MFMPTPARLHNKLCVVERRNSVIRILMQKLLHEVEYAKKTQLGLDGSIIPSYIMVENYQVVLKCVVDIIPPS